MPTPDEVLRMLGPEVSSSQYLSEVKERYHIGRIFYPGCDVDRFLDGAFTPDEVVYLDVDTNVKRPGDNLVVATYEQIPTLFKKGEFDAILFRDTEADLSEVETMLDVVKPGGTVIHSAQADCHDISWELARNPRLERVRLPFRHPYLTTFLKKPDAS